MTQPDVSSISTWRTRLLTALRANRAIFIILVAALALRLVVVALAFATEEPHTSDALYYIDIARHPKWLLYSRGGPVTSIGPIYPVFMAPIMAIIPRSQLAAQLISLRVLQALVDTLSVWLIYRIAAHLFGERAGRVALVAQAFDARYIFQVGAIATETLFIALFCAFMLVYLKASADGSLPGYRWAGVLLGLAVLTRPIPLLFPAALAIHAWLQPGQRRALLGVTQLTAMMLALVIPWTVRTAINAGEWLPVADTAFSHLWLSSRDDGRELGGGELEETAMEDTRTTEPNTSVAEIGSDEYLRAGLANILLSPGRWASRIIRDTLKAYLQPYGTILLVDPAPTGVWDLIHGVLSGQANAGDLLRVPGLGRRAAMYIWHFWGLLGGVIGAVYSRSQWRSTLPLAGWILYCTAILSLLLIEPRYLFPVMFAFTVLAAFGSVRLWGKLTGQTGRLPSLERSA